ncbi:hypothetical protein [Chryseobacterium shigense]|uniref:Uncharacterized protein n=1 Tax=Chryseobacterium shigense TaxID=297244 RepID=A0A841NCW3_9FLAO|nr:hypothetical protein [Chryseobacterium shigense]MBB6369872.1 hypothetical protein [Chryseobacterium shigense]
MRLNLLILFFVLSANYIYSQKTINLIVDPKIKVASLKNINTTDSPTDYSIDSIYQTTVRAKLMVEDTVSFNQLENSEYLKKSFMCHHYFKNDTLIIKGGFGLRYQMYGFIAKVLPNKKAEVKLQLNWGYPSYFNSRNEESAKSKILVTTKKSKLIINRLPKNKLDKKHIYGYVEFISDDYFVEMKNKKTQIPYKEKNSLEYRIYFDSRYLDSEE